ncbi:MAG TPA: glycosyl hydrolase family 8 [Clostridia bacterium]|nr:glycosyl hydrolase family 8 [Clostridia bacterium]
MKRLIGTVTIAAFFCYVICYAYIYSSFDRNLPVKSAFSSSGTVTVNRYKAMELTSLDFIERKLIGPKGEIYTSIRNGRLDKETLSESIGLIMEYSVASDRKELFDREYEYLRDHLLSEGNYIRWKYGRDITCNSLIDDLRIIRALLNAHEKWGGREYFDSAGFMQETIFTSQVRDGGICELYDWKYRIAKDVMPLCYPDFYTMNRLNAFNNGWVKVGDDAVKTVKNGLIKQGKPLFNKYYNFENESYSMDEEMSENKGVCLTYTIYTALHLAEINENTEQFTKWLKNEMKKGRLYAWYHPISLKPVQKIESTAVYALAAMYADKVGEDKLAERLTDKMLGFMIKNKKSLYYGGFGDQQSGEFYSFDNLTALLALAVVAK